MIETEVKLTFEDKPKVEKLLEDFGAVRHKEVTIKDAYYGIDGATMDDSKSILRLRTKTGQEPELTFKGDLVELDGIWERTEINVNVSSARDITKILQRLPISYVYTNESFREYWVKDELEIVFIFFKKPKDLQVLEIEGPKHEEIKSLVAYLGDSVKTVGREIFEIFV